MIKNGARAVQKLEALMGTAAAQDLVNKTMTAARVTNLDDPNELYRFAEELLKGGGVIEAVGRAIKIQAILSGASEFPEAPTRGRKA